MSISEMISIAAIVVAFVTFVATNVWNSKNHRKDIKKDTILSISGALNRQTQLVVKMADPSMDQTEINRVLSENEYIFGQMYTAVSAETSSAVLCYLADLAETFYELGLKRHSSNLDQQSTFLFAIQKHSDHMKQLPTVIVVLKQELGIKGGVSELEQAITSSCERINTKITSLLKPQA
ncbi:hypothetical protein [Enterovibrio calviensis]|uniref:hypothetical protein n=1 Tax=Enterovibrio calviensis TaxID=91359 RepID=UPI0037366C69